MIGAPLGGRSLRYAYMDHWRVETAQGPLSQYTSLERFDAFLKQIAGVGFEAIETFDFHLGALRDLAFELRAPAFEEAAGGTLETLRQRLELAAAGGGVRAPGVQP